MYEKKIPLHKKHENLNAKMASFAGYIMPLRYTSDKEEHLCVRNSVGVFDVSHMGEFMIAGEGAQETLQHITTNDVSALADNQAQYTCMPNTSGGIIDDLLIYRFNAKSYMVVVNASNIAKDYDWIQKHKLENTTVQDFSEETVLLAVQGPKASNTLQPLTSTDLFKIKYYTFCETQLAGKDIILSATGYTGSGGFELYIPKEHASDIWDQIFKAGKPYNIQPIGLGARDTLRLEMGFCLYGNDIDDNTSPLEAGLGWITKFNNKFTAFDLIENHKKKGLVKKLIGFKMLERGIPRNGYSLLNDTNEIIGNVTSGTLSPSMNIGIGMGYVALEYAKKGSIIHVEIRNKKLKAEIVRPPFI